MRILPVCIYLKYLQEECGLKDGTCLEIVHKMSALTHAHLRSKMSCGIYFYCVRELAKRNKPLEELLQNAVDLSFSFYEQNNDSKKELEHFSRIRNMEKLEKIPVRTDKQRGICDRIHRSSSMVSAQYIGFQRLCVESGKLGR